MNVVPLLIPIWVQFSSAPKSIPKLVRKIEMFRSIFGTLFSGLKALQVALERLLERLMLVLRAHKIRKYGFTTISSHFLQIVCFRYFEVLEDLLGPMLALLGPF